MDYTRERMEKILSQNNILVQPSILQICGLVHNFEKKPQVKKFLIPSFIGIKENEITLVWENELGIKETTKAVRSEIDSHDFQLGFLIAYYKKVHENKSSKEVRNKIVEIFESYKGRQEIINAYFDTVYLDNCGLSIANATRFIKYICNRSGQSTIVIPENFLREEIK